MNRMIERFGEKALTKFLCKDEIKLVKNHKTAPRLRLAKKLLDEFNISDYSLSITHDGDYAIAVVAIETKK